MKEFKNIPTKEEFNKQRILDLISSLKIYIEHDFKDRVNDWASELKERVKEYTK